MKQLLLLLLLIPLLTSAKKKTHHPFLAMSSYEYTHPVYDTTIKDIWRRPLSDKLIVKTTEGKKKYNIKEVWGYRDRSNDEYRIYKGELYALKQADTLSIYRQHHGKSNHYYFSQGLDGDIYRLNTKPLKTVYATTNPLFINDIKRQIKWYQSYEGYSRKERSYRIVSIYKRSLHNIINP